MQDASNALKWYLYRLSVGAGEYVGCGVGTAVGRGVCVWV